VQLVHVLTVEALPAAAAVAAAFPWNYSQALTWRLLAALELPSSCRVWSQAFCWLALIALRLGCLWELLLPCWLQGLSLLLSELLGLLLSYWLRV
jgi:hypothetical protein